MKKILSVFLFLLAVNTLVPIFYFNVYSAFESKINVNNNNDDNIFIPTENSDQKVILFDESAAQTIELDLIDYLIGAAACEMPASYESEAIKAQMIAIHSYYLYCQQHPEYLSGGYITVNESNMKGYASKTRLTEYWGMNFYDYYNKFQRCANEIHNQIITYQGQPALAAYHAVSCGKTRKSNDVWQQDLPYLTCVDSSFDAVSDDYLQMKTFTVSGLYGLLKTTFPFIRIDESTPEEWFGEVIYTDSGYASYVIIAGDYVPADQFRNALGLASTCVLVFFEDDTFSVATKGYGHGVGMSQFGANQLSQQGKNYKEILAYYYPGTELI